MNTFYLGITHDANGVIQPAFWQMTPLEIALHELAHDVFGHNAGANLNGDGRTVVPSGLNVDLDWVQEARAVSAASYVLEKYFGYPQWITYQTVFRLDWTSAGNRFITTDSSQASAPATCFVQTDLSDAECVRSRSFRSSI